MRTSPLRAAQWVATSPDPSSARGFVVSRLLPASPFRVVPGFSVAEGSDVPSHSPSLDKFLKPTFSLDSVDTYVIRTALLTAVTSHLPVLTGRLLDVGCGQMPYRELIATTDSSSRLATSTTLRA